MKDKNNPSHFYLLTVTRNFNIIQGKKKIHKTNAITIMNAYRNMDDADEFFPGSLLMESIIYYNFHTEQKNYFICSSSPIVYISNRIHGINNIAILEKRQDNFKISFKNTDMYITIPVFSLYNYCSTLFVYISENAVKTSAEHYETDFFQSIINGYLLSEKLVKELYEKKSTVSDYAIYTVHNNQVEDNS